MGWDRSGRYYSRSWRVNGRVVSEYVGRGELGQWAAAQDAEERRQREAARAARKEERAELDALAASVRDVDKLADLLVTGHRQHHRGEWRKQRGTPQPAER
jgi:hypothetical protein